MTKIGINMNMQPKVTMVEYLGQNTKYINILNSATSEAGPLNKFREKQAFT